MQLTFSLFKWSAIVEHIIVVLFTAIFFYEGRSKSLQKSAPIILFLKLAELNLYSNTDNIFCNVPANIPVRT